MKEFHLDEDTSKWLREENKKQNSIFKFNWDTYGDKSTLFLDGNSTFYISSDNPEAEPSDKIVNSISEYFFDVGFTIRVVKPYGRELDIDVDEDKLEEVGYADYLASIYRGEHFVGVLSDTNGAIIVRFFSDDGAVEYFNEWNNFENGFDETQIALVVNEKWTQNYENFTIEGTTGVTKSFKGDYFPSEFIEPQTLIDCKIGDTEIVKIRLEYNDPEFRTCAAKVDMFEVHRDFRGQGVGKKIMMWLHEFLWIKNGFNYVVIDTEPINYAFCASCGFQMDFELGERWIRGIEDDEFIEDGSINDVSGYKGTI